MPHNCLGMWGEQALALRDRLDLLNSGPGWSQFLDDPGARSALVELKTVLHRALGSPDSPSINHVGGLIPSTELLSMVASVSSGLQTHEVGGGPHFAVPGAPPLGPGWLQQGDPEPLAVQTAHDLVFRIDDCTDPAGSAGGQAARAKKPRFEFKSYEEAREKRAEIREAIESGRPSLKIK